MRHDDLEGLRVTGKVGTWERDVETGVMRWNGAIVDILGIPGAEPSLAAMLDRVVPEDRERVEAALEGTFAQRSTHDRIDYRCRLPDGREVEIRNEWSLEADASGRPVIHGVLLDVTHRLRTKAELRRQAELLELLYDVAACANEAETVLQVLDVSLERICSFGGFSVGHVLLASDGDPRELIPSGVSYSVDYLRHEPLLELLRATRLSFGAGAAGEVGRMAEPTWSANLRGRFPGPIAAAAARAGLRAAFELPVLVGDETVAVIACFGAEPRPPDQLLIQAMVHVAAQIGRVFERKQVERMKDEFVSVVSHELRTPITSIQGAIGLLESGVLGALSSEALEMARIAREGCGRLLRLVNELLDIQKLESGAPALFPAPMPLGPVLERAVAASRPHAAALGIRLDLDDAAPDTIVCADADRISQVVQNLLSNALKYSPPGERIRVLATRTAGGVRVSVEDRGPGVAEEFRRRLFRKFSQADASDARQKAGTGLGLAICKAIIDKLGGTIGHEPILGGGARFYFELRELPAA